MIVIASTFTAEPVETSLGVLVKRSGQEASSEIKFAPYNQLIQQLLSPHSLFHNNKQGMNVILLRYSDYIKYKEAERGNVRLSDFHEEIERHIDELLDSMERFAHSSETPLILAICPDSPNDADAPKNVDFYIRMEKKIRQHLKKMNDVHLIVPDDIQSMYPVDNYDDAVTNKMGHIPYTNLFFSALALTLARKMYAVSASPHKVIVLDCDNTLWKGVCGEVGPKDILIDASRRFLQEFMLKQYQSGKLLCLCSKNVEEDVWAVFDEPSNDMLLQREHITAHTINWDRKSENLSRLAKKLNLGLDSFIFVDDNPVECAEVRSLYPQVLTIQLPQNDDQIKPLLKNTWAFDQHRAVTKEDSKRTEFYRQNVAREELQTSSINFESFIAGLGLKIEIEEMQQGQVSRVSQLTHRTNQFNFTTTRLREGQVQKLLTKTNEGCLTVKVRDKFGDYGLVGAIFFEIKKDIFEISNFLLSCRVLGKGVAHRMISELGKLSERKKTKTIHLNFIPSAKNRPAFNFLSSITKASNQLEDKTIYTLSTNQAKNCSFKITENKVSNKGGDKGVKLNRVLARPKAQTKDLSVIQIAQKFQTPLQLLSHLRAEKIDQVQNVHLYKPLNEEIKPLIQLLEEVLLKQPIRPSHKLSELGVNSLQTVMIISKIRTQFKVALKILDFFQLNTVQEIALKINQYRTGGSESQGRAPDANLVTQFVQMVKDRVETVKVVDERYQVSYEIFKPEHVEEATQLAARVFSDPIRGEVMTKHLKCTYQETYAIFKSFCAMAPELGVSIIAKNVEGKMIGMTTAFDFATPDPELDEKAMLKFAPIFAVIDAIESHLPPGLKKEKGKCLHQFLLAVKPGAPQNVAFIMNKLELEVARLKGFQTSVSEPTGPISQPLLAELGYKVVSTLCYDTFEYEGKKVFEGVGDTYMKNLPKDLLPKQMKFDGCQLLMMSLDPRQTLRKATECLTECNFLGRSKKQGNVQFEETKTTSRVNLPDNVNSDTYTLSLTRAEYSAITRK